MASTFEDFLESASRLEKVRFSPPLCLYKKHCIHVSNFTVQKYAYVNPNLTSVLFKNKYHEQISIMKKMMHPK
jgi:hypothetical protein